MGERNKKAKLVGDETTQDEWDTSQNDPIRQKVYRVVNVVYHFHGKCPFYIIHNV